MTTTPGQSPTSNRSFELRLEFLHEEYVGGEATIRAYDEHVYKIKGWAITICSAIALFGIENNRPAMYLVGVVAAVGFWMLDAYAKAIQRIFIDRVRSIEDFIHSRELDQACRDLSLHGLRVDAIGEVFRKGRVASLKRLSNEMRLFGSYFLYLSLVALMLTLLLIEVAS